MRDNTVNLRGSETQRRAVEDDFSAPSGPEEPVKHKRKGWRRLLRPALYIIVGIAVIWLIFAAIASGTAWRAVFLSNNQVYFGHFWDIPFSSSITLRNVYYLQVAQTSQQLAGQDQSQLKLVKLGNEIHGPTGEMTIPMSQVLFWETLRSDSAIVKTIQNGQPR